MGVDFIGRNVEMTSSRSGQMKAKCRLGGDEEVQSDGALTKALTLLLAA